MNAPHIESVESPRARMPEPLFKQIAETLRERMLSGYYQRGSYLPSERDLAEEFNVSRVPIREAFKALEYIGAIRNDPGRGMRVESPDLLEMIGRVASFGVEKPEDVRLQLIDFLLMVVVPSAAEAALKAQEEHVKALSALIASLRESTPEAERIDRAVEEFYLLIVGLNDNRISLSCATLCMNIWRLLVQRSRRDLIDLQHSMLELFEAMLYAWQTHDQALASQLMRERLNRVKVWSATT